MISRTEQARHLHEQGRSDNRKDRPARVEMEYPPYSGPFFSLEREVGHSPAMRYLSDRL